MPREIEIKRNPQVAGGEAEVQQQANQLEAAAQPARAQQKQAQPAPPQLTDQDPPFGVELDDSEQQDLLPAYGNEDEEFLFGATDYPDTPANFGVTSTQPPAPRNTMQYLGTLADAASDPNAPDEIHMLLRVLTDLIEE